MKQANWMISLIGSFALSACGGDMGDSTVLRDDATNTCFTDKITPAIIETAIEHRQVADGTFETHKRPVIIREREVMRIDLICPEDQSSDFIASLQRAFKARNLYGGPVTGTWTAETKKTLFDYQTVRGLDTQEPTLAVAQELGLAITPIKR